MTPSPGTLDGPGHRFGPEKVQPREDKQKAASVQLHFRRRILPIFAFLSLGALALPVASAELLIQADRPFKQVDHAASGSLYGLAANGWPADTWIAAIAPKNFTQMAPDGKQLPNGERVPVGDALKVAPIAARHGASVTIRMPDIFPSFPYQWRGEEFWFDAVDKMIAETVADNPPNVYAYEIWNEPDWNWKPQWGDFDAIWSRTYHAIRKIDPNRSILGPSISTWNEPWMRRFLDRAIATGTVPDIISWHELDPRTAADLGGHVSAYRKLEKELGIGPLPISINEYGPPRDSAVPGALTRLVARLERAKVDTANLAFWHKPGRLADLIAPVKGGRGPAKNAEPTGAFWVYKWYGDMRGEMLTTIPEAPGGVTLDGFAALDPQTHVLRAVIGGQQGEHTIKVTGLAELGGTANVQIYETVWTGTDGAIRRPNPISEQKLNIENGALTVSLDAENERNAYLILISPAGSAPSFPGTDKRYRIRYEAEEASVTGGRTVPIRMSKSNFFAPTLSGDAYVSLLNPTDAEIRFIIDAPAAGRYRLVFGYSNGSDDTLAAQVTVGDATPVNLDFTPTQFRELIDTVSATATLPAGRSHVVLQLDPQSTPKDPFAPSLLDVDFLDVVVSSPSASE